MKGASFGPVRGIEVQLARPNWKLDSSETDKPGGPARCQVSVEGSKAPTPDWPNPPQSPVTGLQLLSPKVKVIGSPPDTRWIDQNSPAPFACSSGSAVKP